ncbi:hypothetical protein LTR70_007003 [Exophiala xenobiotica]|uniref:DUF202 domain-containing protein n=1 Tax=Lithohypha guttulata TaxID=1690604 RepID=A0ABR0K6A8_9EURO|nr:hypothetical protein LTR24_006880 [Lithohypha guttulata]KAK5314704.1 hypothetical protein LTR70_007003 [Exophiala xenobiotica]
MRPTLRHLFKFPRTPSYSNTGSVARDHLASERTFLAWIRTGLGFVALGIAVERFSQLDLESLIDHLLPDHAKPSRQSRTEAEKETRERQDREQLLVGTLLGSGGGSIVYGVARYFSTMRTLEKGAFKPAYFGAAGLGIVVSGLAGAAYYGTLRREAGRWEAEKEADRQEYEVSKRAKD